MHVDNGLYDAVSAQKLPVPSWEWGCNALLQHKSANDDCTDGAWLDLWHALLEIHQTLVTECHHCAFMQAAT